MSREVPSTIAEARELAEANKGLHTALLSVDPKSDGKNLNPRVIGNRFRSWRNRVMDGRRLVRAGDKRHAVLWKLEKVPEV